MAVEARTAQVDGAREALVDGQHLLLHLHRQRQVILPLGVAQPHVVGAHHQHHLGHALAVDLGAFGVADPFAVDDGIPVDVQHHLDGGILLHIFLNAVQRMGVGAVVAGVVVLGGVVNDGQPHILEDLFHLFSHPHHVVIIVQRPSWVGLLVFVLLSLGVRLRSVGVNDQDLGAFLGRL